MSFVNLNIFIVHNANPPDNTNLIYCSRNLAMSVFKTFFRFIFGFQLKKLNQGNYSGGSCFPVTLLAKLLRIETFEKRSILPDQLDLFINVSNTIF